MGELDNIAKSVHDVASFVQEKYDPMRDDMNLQKEEITRLTEEVRGVLYAQKEMKRAALLGDDVHRRRSLGPEFGKYEGMDSFDVGLLKSLHSAAVRNPKGIDPNRLVVWGEHLDTVTRALDSTTSGLGDELVPTDLMTEMWDDVSLATSVGSLFRTINMPTNPFDIPLELGDIQFYRGTANVAATSSDPATSKRTMTAGELVAVVAWSLDLDEDSAIAILPEVRRGVVRRAAEVIDDQVLNGDTTDAGANINADGAGSGTLAGQAGKDHLLAFDGLIKTPIVSNTSQANNHSGVVTDDMFNEIRAKLDKYGVRPSELAWITDLNLFIRAQSISNYRTIDKLGANATLLTGQLGDVEGVPVIVSEQMLLADTDGKVTSGGNGTDTSRLLIVNRTQHWRGTKRDLTIETERDIQKRQTVMVISFRNAFLSRTAAASDSSVAAQYNITGTS